MKQIFKIICLFSSLVTHYDLVAAPKIQAKIIGGSSAKADAWPWMAALVIKNTNTSIFCGGSLVASNWVLTAAHCMFDETPAGSGHYVPSTIADFDVLLNRLQLNTSNGERIAPAEIIVHPAFNQKDLTNDLALIRLSRHSAVQPIETLPDFSSLDKDGVLGTALGWGNTSATKNQFPTTLQQVNLPITSNASCQSKLDGITDSMLCAGSLQGGIDTCEGDSGGPLIAFDAERNAWRQVGITSFGEAECGAANFYGVYTRLTLFKSFISNTICNVEQTPPAPILTLTTNGATVTAAWTLSNKATGYRLNFAPYPNYTFASIASVELNPTGQLSVTLPQNSAYYVAITSYNNNCRSEFSNIEHFVIQ